MPKVVVTAKIGFDEAARLLSMKDVFPSDDDLLRFPFGDKLVDLCSRPDYKKHAEAVLRYMNILLSRIPDELIPRIGQQGKKLLLETQKEIGDLFGGFENNEEAQALFRIGALYHDIGKYIIKERHPTIGWYTLEYLDEPQKDLLRELLGGREDYLQLLMIMVRDHDEFGVLSTGEASYPILLRPANSLGDYAVDRQRIISAIMWLNLADMAGTPGLVLTEEDLGKVIGDWKWFLQAVDHCTQEHEELDAYVICEASKEENVVKRISRLLLEASRDAPARHEELCERNHQMQTNNGAGSDKAGGLDKSGERIVAFWAKQQLQTMYPTKIPRQDFESNITHICKMDYGLRFFRSLVAYCEGPNPKNEKRAISIYAEERVDTTDLIYAVLGILRRMASTYSPMIRSDNGQGNLIGVELKDLTPGNAQEKTAQIIALLLKSHYPGLSWLMSDCLAWYF